MRVEWTDGARGDLGDIDEELSARDEVLANAFVARLFERAEGLADFPDQGVAVPEAAGVRQLVVDRYRLVYRREPDVCLVLRVLWPGQMLRRL